MTTDPVTLLAGFLSEELVTGDTVRKLYSTDVSEYQEMTLAVAFPKTDADMLEIICFAAQPIGIIPPTEKLKVWTPAR